MTPDTIAYTSGEHRLAIEKQAVDKRQTAGSAHLAEMINRATAPAGSIGNKPAISHGDIIESVCPRCININAASA
jgi:hypothetical protein